MKKLGFTNCDIYTGEEVLHDRTLIVNGDRIEAAIPLGTEGMDVDIINLKGRCIAPGFIDIQVNGGGGILFNDMPTEVEALEKIGIAHLKYGTTSFLPTLITSDTEHMRQAYATVKKALDAHMPGVLGLHYEGPYIEDPKAGVHDKNYIRKLSESECKWLASTFPVARLVTLSPEAVSSEQISSLSKAGLRISAGHTSSSYEAMEQAVKSGLSCVTHLYNAMTQLSSREPGVVGYVMGNEIYCGIIVDGYHVHFASVRASFRSISEGKMLLVTDAMPPVGVEGDASFELGPYSITVQNGKCVTSDGVLAGSALDMATAVRNCVQKVGIALPEALRMASLYPAQFLGMARELGYIKPGYYADFVIFDNQIQVHGVCQRGKYQQF